MAEIDFSKYDEINKELNDNVMERVRQSGMLRPDNTMAFYRDSRDDFSRQELLFDKRQIQFGILFHQMKSMIEEGKSNISDLESYKVLLENDDEIDQEAIQRAENNINKAKELLAVALARFEKFSETQVDGREVLSYIAEFKANCIIDNIYSAILHDGNFTASQYIGSSFPNDIASKYSRYQELLGRINKKDPGLKKYYEYMAFMREKDEKAYTNRFWIRQFEKAYAGSYILATPNYQKGKNTILDMSRYQAFHELCLDLPMNLPDIQEFIKKSHVLDRDGQDHSQEEI